MPSAAELLHPSRHGLIRICPSWMLDGYWSVLLPDGFVAKKRGGMKPAHYPTQEEAVLRAHQLIRREKRAKK